MAKLPSGNIPINIIENNPIILPRKLSGDTVCIAVLLPETIIIEQKPIIESSEIDSRKDLENANEKIQMLDRILQKAIILFMPSTFCLEARYNAPVTAPIPDAPINIPSPFAPLCKI